MTEIKLIKKSILAIILSISLVGTAWGANIPKENVSRGNLANIMVNGINARGQFIALGILEMTNLGGGYIGIFIQTLSYEDVDKIKQKVYLDKYNEKTGTWAQMASYDFTYLSEDYGGSLSDPYEDFQVRGEIGNYYRLRALHGVWKNGIFESFSSTTDGLLITR